MPDPPAAPGPRGVTEVVELDQLQEAHARRVAESKATVPHIYLEVLAEPVDEAAGATEGVVWAAANALREFPRLNGAYRDGCLELHSRVNVAVAVAAEATVLYPTIHDAAAKEPATIAAELDAAAERARSGAITQPELSGATFSIADLSPWHVARAALIVNRGQAAILGVGAPRPDVRSLCLAADGRMVSAHDGAAFLSRLAQLLTTGR